MEHGTIERELHIDASPEVVFDVVSSPEHVREWWPDEAEYPVVPGGAGRICFGDPADGGTWVQFTVVDAVPPRLFSFRWTHAEGEVAAPGNSMLVVFELEPAGSGTRLRMASAALSAAATVLRSMATCTASASIVSASTCCSARAAERRPA